MGMTQADMAGPPPEEMAGPPPEETTPDNVMGAMEDERLAQMETIAATAPNPEKPFSVALVQKLVQEMNEFLAMVDPNMATIEFVPEGERVEGPLPPEVYVPFVLIMSFMAQFEGKGYEKFIMNPEEFINDAGVRKATALIQMMQNDPDLIADMRKVPGEAGEEPEEEPIPEDEMPPAEPMPGEYDEDDEALMQTM